MTEFDVVVDETTFTVTVPTPTFTLNAPAPTFDLQSIGVNFDLDVSTPVFSLGVTEPIFQLTASGIPGPPGSTGPAGDPFTTDVTAGANLSGHHFVILNSSRAAVYADNSQSTHLGRVLGMTSGAISNAASGPVKLGGVVTEGGWSWTPDLPIYLGRNGSPTQTVPSMGAGDFFSQIVGVALASDTILLNLNPDPIVLS